MINTCCSLHEHPISIIISSDQTTKLGCIDCYLKLNEDESFKDSYKIINIPKALKSPSYLATQLSIDDRYKIFLNHLSESNKLDCQQRKEDILKLINSIKLSLVDLFNSIETFVDKTLDHNRGLNESIQEIIQYGKFKDVVNQLQDNNLAWMEILKVEEQLNHYFKNLDQHNGSFINESFDNLLTSRCNQVKEYQINQENLHILNIGRDIKSLLEMSQQFNTALYPNYDFCIYQVPNQSIVPQCYLQNLISIISQKTEKKVKQINLLQKLNGNNPQNLKTYQDQLYIFESSNAGNIFGGFSSSLGSMKQFLFSYTRRQIYHYQELQQRVNEINYNHFNQNALLAYSKDMIIIDFKNGSSKLGTNYYCLEKKNLNDKCLFGGVNPNIVECEVYQIIFI